MAKETIIPVFVPHLGCPHRCVFCNQHRISGQGKPATAADVARALQKARFLGIKNAELAFYGGSFTAISAEKQTELLTAAREGFSDGTVASLRVSTRPDCISEEILLRLRSFGVGTIELGCQSADDAVLSASGRGHDAACITLSAQKIKRHGFSLILQMMTGLPESTPAKDLATAKTLAALRPDGVRIYPTVILRDSELYDLWRAGHYTEHTVETAVALCADILPVFESAGIPVIRLGLNPTEELSSGEAVAGAYHPAFGELVRSELLFRLACEKIEAAPGEGGLCLAVAPRDLSAMIGQHKSNLSRLRAFCAPRSLRVVADAACPPREIQLTAES